MSINTPAQRRWPWQRRQTPLDGRGKLRAQLENVIGQEAPVPSTDSVDALLRIDAVRRTLDDQGTSDLPAAGPLLLEAAQLYAAHGADSEMVRSAVRNLDRTGPGAVSEFGLGRIARGQADEGRGPIAREVETLGYTPTSFRDSLTAAFEVGAFEQLRRRTWTGSALERLLPRLPRAQDQGRSPAQGWSRP
jgi:hypothetical protein